MQVAGRWLPGVACQLSVGPWAKGMASLGLHALLYEADLTTDVIPRAGQRRAPSPRDLGRNLQASGGIGSGLRERQGLAQSARGFQRGRK